MIAMQLLRYWRLFISIAVIILIIPIGFYIYEFHDYVLLSIKDCQKKY